MPSSAIVVITRKVNVALSRSSVKYLRSRTANTEAPGLRFPSSDAAGSPAILPRRAAPGKPPAPPSERPLAPRPAALVPAQPARHEPLHGLARARTEAPRPQSRGDVARRHARRDARRAGDRRDPGAGARQRVARPALPERLHREGA